MIEARSWHDNAIIVRRLVEDDTWRHGNAASSGVRASKIWIRAEATFLDMAWHEDNCRWLPLRSIMAWTACDPRRSRDLHLHHQGSLPGVTSVYRDRNARFHSNRSYAYPFLRTGYRCWFNHAPRREARVERVIKIPFPSFAYSMRIFIYFHLTYFDGYAIYLRLTLMLLTA